MNPTRRTLLAAFAAFAATGCALAGSGGEAPLPGPVSDLPAFERFIATRPTPAQFAKRHPDVVLVLPGQIATKELRMDRSRYFAQLDAEGRITGGRFQ